MKKVYCFKCRWFNGHCSHTTNKREVDGWHSKETKFTYTPEILNGKNDCKNYEADTWIERLIDKHTAK